MDVHFENIHLSVLLLFAVTFFVLRTLRIGVNVKKRGVLAKKNNRSTDKRYRLIHNVRLGLYSLALVLLALALMRPVGNPQEIPTVKINRDIVLLMDISKSMLAKDVIPNRLEKAKDIVRNLMRSLSGERMALFVFAGKTSVVSPLTSDYYFFLKALDRVNTKSVTKGGSEIGTAIDYAIQTLFVDDEKNKKNRRHIILITDGDNLTSEPLASASKAAKQNIVIHTVSVGTEKGGKIPVDESSLEYVTHDNQTVITRPDNDMLKQIATITGGVFIPAGSATVQFGGIYKRYFTFDAIESDDESSQTKIWTEYYRYFLFVVLALILLDKPITTEITRRFDRRTAKRI